MARDFHYSSLPVRGMHVDCIGSMLRFDRIVQVFHDVARWGYNTVLLEYGPRFPYTGPLNQVRAADALTKRQVKELDALAASLGLRIMPLVQCLGHLGYLMRFSRFDAFSEGAGTAKGRRVSRRAAGYSDTVCPSNPKSLDNFKRRVAPVLEAHPNLRYFHMGGDEGHLNSDCIWCRPRLRKIGLSRVLTDHYIACATWLRRQGPDPIIWSDMPLGHPEALDELREHVIIMDWDYHSRIQPDKGLRIWGVPSAVYRTPSKWPVVHRRLFADYIYDEKGRLRPFPYVSFLRDQGFRVIVAPAVRSFGDSHTVPQAMHMENVIGAARKASEEHILGAVVTGWGLRRAPWPLLERAFIAGGMALNNPRVTRKEIDRQFVVEHFGMRDPNLAKVADALSQNVFHFTDSQPGYDMATGRYPARAYDLRLENICKDVPRFRREVRSLRSGLKKAEPLLAKLAPKTVRQKRNTALWRWARDVLGLYADVADELLKEPGTHDPAVLKDYRKRCKALTPQGERLLKQVYTDESVLEEQQTRFGTMIDWLNKMIDAAEKAAK